MRCKSLHTLQLRLAVQGLGPCLERAYKEVSALTDSDATKIAVFASLNLSMKRETM
jgi:hypothetical protein